MLNKKFVIILSLFLMWASSTEAAKKKTPYKDGIRIGPGESQTVTIASDVPMEIGWKAVQEPKCTMNCVEAVDKTGDNELAVATDLGAYFKYHPRGGKITVEYRNKADHPVVINVYTIQRSCDAEACSYLNGNANGRWLVYRIGKFTAIETSKDRSYSTIAGVTTEGKPFTVKALWWTDNPEGSFQCAKSIDRYLKENVSETEYAPYILSGKTLGDDPSVLQSIDTCSPKAPNFGVSPENVFR